MQSYQMIDHINQRKYTSRQKNVFIIRVSCAQVQKQEISKKKNDVKKGLKLGYFVLLLFFILILEEMLQY